MSLCGSAHPQQFRHTGSWDPAVTAARMRRLGANMTSVLQPEVLSSLGFEG